MSRASGKSAGHLPDAGATPKGFRTCLGLGIELTSSFPMTDVRDSFKTTANTYRQNKARSNVFWMGGGVAALVAILLHRYSFVSAAAFCTFLILATLSIRRAFSLLSVSCPACKGDVLAFGSHCPACGGPFETLSWVFAPKCAKCSRHLGQGRLRTYRIRYCTHCGAYLDETGI